MWHLHIGTWEFWVSLINQGEYLEDFVHNIHETFWHMKQILLCTRIISLFKHRCQSEFFYLSPFLQCQILEPKVAIDRETILLNHSLWKHNIFESAIMSCLLEPHTEIAHKLNFINWIDCSLFLNFTIPSFFCFGLVFDSWLILFLAVSVLLWFLLIQETFWNPSAWLISIVERADSMTDFILQLEREVNETKKIVRYCCKENGKETKKCFLEVHYCCWFL